MLSNYGVGTACPSHIPPTFSSAEEGSMSADEIAGVQWHTHSEVWLSEEPRVLILEQVGTDVSQMGAGTLDLEEDLMLRDELERIISMSPTNRLIQSNIMSLSRALQDHIHWHNLKTPALSSCVLWWSKIQMKFKNLSKHRKRCSISLEHKLKLKIGGTTSEWSQTLAIIKKSTGKIWRGVEKRPSTLYLVGL